MTNSLPLLIYDAEFHKAPFLVSTFVISVVYKQYATSCRLWSISLCRWYMSLLFQHKDLEWIKENLTKNFSNRCYWFVDNKLNIHFGMIKPKLSFTKSRKRKIGTLNIQYCNIKIKQYSKVTFRLWVRRELASGGYGFQSYK